MPISSISKGIANALMFLPGTYGTSLLHEHFMGGAIDKLGGMFGAEYAKGARKGFDCILEFFGTDVSEWVCFLVIGITVAVLVAAYVLICTLRQKRIKK